MIRDSGLLFLDPLYIYSLVN